MRGILYILASFLPSLKRQMYANKLRVQLLQKSYFYEFFFFWGIYTFDEIVLFGFEYGKPPIQNKLIIYAVTALFWFQRQR